MGAVWRDARGVRRRRRSSSGTIAAVVAAGLAVAIVAAQADEGPGRVGAAGSNLAGIDANTLTTSCGSLCSSVPNAKACLALDVDLETCVATRQMNGATCRQVGAASSVVCLAPAEASNWKLLLTSDAELLSVAKNGLPITDDSTLANAIVLNASDVAVWKNFAMPTETTQLTLRAAVETGDPLKLAVSTDVITSWQSLERLSVRDVDLSATASLPAFNKLISLDLSSCRLKKWSTGATPALSILDLSSNELSALPNGSLPVSLNVLNVSSNNLVELPVDLTSMTGLFRLSMSNNSLATLTEFPKLPALKELYLSSSSLSSVPPGIANLPVLQILDLSHNNFASNMANGFPASLNSLKLRSCNLRIVPGDFGIEKTWELVDLSENPFNAGAFAGVKLRANNLILEQVQLTEISSNIKNWAVGNKLVLSKNALGTVDAESLPADIADLRLANCSLKEVPDNLKSLRRLTILDLSENSLGLILNGILPTALTELYLGNCKLEEVPADVQSMGSTLQKLDLSSNNLTTVELEKFSSLQYLDLHDNALKSIPESVFNMPSLTSLDLRGNPISLLNITNDRIAFLSKLRTFEIDASAFDVKGTCVESVVFRGKFKICTKVVETTPTPITTDVPSSAVPSPSPSSTSKSSKSNWTLNIVLGCAVLFVMIVSVIVARMPKSRCSGDDEEEGYDQLATVTNRYGPLDMWDDPELLRWRVDILDIELVMQIGIGANSVLWLARYRTETMVVKRLFHKRSDPHAFERFIEEIKFLGRLVHDNIVHFIGVSWTSEADLQMVLEFLANGDLRKYLKTARTDVSARQWSLRKIWIAINIGEGLRYLHSHDPAFLHRDLRSHHVLLDENYTAKLTDFGLCRHRGSDVDILAGGAVGSRSIAPEVLSGRGSHGRAVDIYAFGVILAELDSHELPFSDITLSNGEPLSEIAMLELLSAGALQPSISPDCPADIARLITDCLSFDASRRPTAENAVRRLRLVLESFQALRVDTNGYDDSAGRVQGSYFDDHDDYNYVEELSRDEDDESDNASYRI